VELRGYGAVLVICGAVTIVFLVLAAIAWWADDRLPPTPRDEDD